MKKAVYFCLLFAVTLFVSCSKSDASDEDFDFSGGYVGGTYWPFALQNSWKLVDADGNEQLYLINNTIVANGKTYYQLKPTGAESLGYPAAMGSANGVFTSYFGQANANGVSISAGEITYINTTKAVNEEWTDLMTLNISGLASGTIKYEHTGKIYEKSNSLTVNGKKYKNVIKTALMQKITNSITGITTEIDYEVWLAEGVGIIHESTTVEGETTTYELVSYSVK